MLGFLRAVVVAGAVMSCMRRCSWEFNHGF